MKKEQIIILLVSFFLGMLLLNVVKNVCGCKVQEGFTGIIGDNTPSPIDPYAGTIYSCNKWINDNAGIISFTGDPPCGVEGVTGDYCTFLRDCGAESQLDELRFNWDTMINYTSNNECGPYENRFTWDNFKLAVDDAIAQDNSIPPCPAPGPAQGPGPGPASGPAPGPASGPTPPPPPPPTSTPPPPPAPADCEGYWDPNWSNPCPVLCTGDSPVKVAKDYITTKPAVGTGGCPSSTLTDCPVTGVRDECGVCGGNGIPEGKCDCDGTGPEDNYDCAGNCLNDSDGDGICDELEIRGCTDATACNYDAGATDDDGTCTYAAQNYDCDGNCLVDTDCAGECGGNQGLDACGRCPSGSIPNGSNPCDPNDCIIDNQYDYNYRCECPTGFNFNGISCERDWCLSNDGSPVDCGAGTCVSDTNGYSCVCNDDYYNENPTDPCVPVQDCEGSWSEPTSCRYQGQQCIGTSRYTISQRAEGGDDCPHRGGQTRSETCPVGACTSPPTPQPQRPSIVISDAYRDIVNSDGTIIRGPLAGRNFDPSWIPNREVSGEVECWNYIYGRTVESPGRNMCNEYCNRPGVSGVRLGDTSKPDRVCCQLGAGFIPPPQPGASETNRYC